MAAICRGARQQGFLDDLKRSAAYLYDSQGKYEQAEPLLVRAMAICEQQLGPQHPQTQITRGNYVALLRAMGRDEEAVALETKRMPLS